MCSLFLFLSSFSDGGLSLRLRAVSGYRAFAPGLIVSTITQKTGAYNNERKTERLYAETEQCRGNGTELRSFDAVPVFITDLPRFKNQIGSPRETSDLERKNNTIGRPDAACGGW